MWRRPEKDLQNPPGMIRYTQEPSKKTFEQWWLEYNTLNGCPPAHIVAKAAWEASKEN